MSQLSDNDLKWHYRFLDLAKLVASWSKDPSTKTGAVIVDEKRRIVSVGYNGFPQDMRDEPADYADRQIKYSKIIHCEVNALLFSNRSVEGCALYTWPFLSCERCAVQMIQSGIVTAVAPILGVRYGRWSDSVDRARNYFIEAGVMVLELPDPSGPVQRY
jgi:dCMP deaminase